MGGKNLILDLILAGLAPKFFCGFYLLWNVANYHYMRFQGKRIIQTQENGKKLYFGPDLGPLGLTLFCQIFFQKSGFVSYQVSWSVIIM